MNETLVTAFGLGLIIALQVLTIIKLKSVRTTRNALTGQNSGDSSQQASVIVDTCALIDGRIRELARAGFITQRIYVPKRVLEELQYMADHGDAYKRSRARYGLDIARSLQEDIGNDQVEVIGGAEDVREVDDALIELALERNASLYTTDYNLNKVARIRGVKVMNVNELAHALRPVFLPGESVTVKVVQKGESSMQGVGYLEDGTMTVIEGAASRIGTVVNAKVERMLQTEAGKMVFASIDRNARGDTSKGQHAAGQQGAKSERLAATPRSRNNNHRRNNQQPKS